MDTINKRMSKIKLFCFPYAGGSAQVYNKWDKTLHPNIELVLVELAGRGRRIDEPFYDNFEELIDDIFNQIKSDILSHSYALFGHSLGALIAYELTEKIKQHEMVGPKHIFYSGKSVPHVEKEREIIYHLLNDKEFKTEVIKLGGTPPEFFQHPELAELFLPVLKNDFKMAEKYVFSESIQRYSGDITVLLGKEDVFTAEQCHQWSAYTSGVCKLLYFNGGHFFIHDEMNRISDIINSTLI